MSIKFSKAMIYPESWHARFERDKVKLSEYKKGKRLLTEDSEADDGSHPKISVVSPEGEKSKLKYYDLLVGLDEKKITY